MYDNMPRPEEFGPNAIKIGDLIIPAKDITTRTGTSTHGPYEAMEWWTPIENHPQYKVAKFDWTVETDYDNYTLVSYVIIELLGDKEDDINDFNMPDIFDGEEYWQIWAEYCRDEYHLKGTWGRINRPKE